VELPPEHCYLFDTNGKAFQRLIQPSVKH